MTPSHRVEEHKQLPLTQHNIPITKMTGKSRWADDEEDAQLEAQRKKEKEEKKRAKAEKARKVEEAAKQAELERQRQEALVAQSNTDRTGDEIEFPNRAAKRRKLSPEPESAETQPRKLLRFEAPGWTPCRSVEDFEKLNDIEEGAYGWVSRAKDSLNGKVVALKRLKMDNAQDGVPVTGLREIQTLRDCSHENIVRLREVVVGEDRNKIEK